MIEFNDPRLPGRFWAKIAVSPSGCWLWTAHVDSRWGYGRFNWRGHMRDAHSAAYRVLVGPVPSGLELDHLCRTTRCVNPNHLEPVTHRENVLRSSSLPAIYAVATHCVNGHPFDDANTYRPTSPPRRVCRACNRAAAARYAAKKRAERAA